MMRINVRCCCTPGLMLGSVAVDEALVCDGRPIMFVLIDGSILTLVVRLASDSYQITPEMQKYANPVVLEQIRERCGRELALYSNDTPLDVVRKISSFIEINQPVPIGQRAST